MFFSASHLFSATREKKKRPRFETAVIDLKTAVIKRGTYSDVFKPSLYVSKLLQSPLCKRKDGQ